jgi:hypothetical protein
MTIATSPHSSPPSPSRAGRSRPRPCSQRRAERAVLGRYTDHAGRPREVIARPGYAGSVLVLDRDARTLADRRLVAHLESDEPAGNAELVCRHYLSDPRGRWCRPVSPEDLRAPKSSIAPSSELSAAVEHGPLVDRESDDLARSVSGLLDRHRRHIYRLGFVHSRLSIPELRWLCCEPGEPGRQRRPVSVREVVASLESYEPVRALTNDALRRYRDDSTVSVAILRAEAERMNVSHIVLNRALRHAVLRAVQTQGMSMSEVALRCGRIKYDARGNASGETSWLARRIGISPEGGEREPTPWVHSDVLALIARSGLGISPREVELG